jgi:hypothetical protein
MVDLAELRAQASIWAIHRICWPQIESCLQVIRINCPYRASTLLGPDFTHVDHRLHGRFAVAHADRECPGKYSAQGGRRPTRWVWGDLFHPGVGLLVLLVITVLNVYKPRGMTRYGWRKQQEAREQRRASQP